MQQKGFMKEVTVMFRDKVAEFEDNMVYLRDVEVEKVVAQDWVRSSGIRWSPVNYRKAVYQSTNPDMSAVQSNITQLGVVESCAQNLGTVDNVMITQQSDKLQIERIIEANIQAINAQIDVLIMNEIGNKGSVVVSRTNQISGYSDISTCMSRMNVLGVPKTGTRGGYNPRNMKEKAAIAAMRNARGLSTEAITGTGGRRMVLCPDDHNSVSADLANRMTLIGKPEEAYNTNYIGNAARFEIKAGDYAPSLRAAGSTTATIDMTSTTNYATPTAQVVNSGGQATNADYRFQTINVTSSSNFQPGDAFTIAGVYAANYGAKQSSNHLKTFRVVTVPSTTSLSITPQIISYPTSMPGPLPTTAQNVDPAVLDYLNCFVPSPSPTAAITLLNSVVSPGGLSINSNPFFLPKSVRLLTSHPGELYWNNSGMFSIPVTGASGITYVLSAQSDNLTWASSLVIRALVGVNVIVPEFAGILIGGQPVAS
jgi:hypothetical protein